MRQKKYLALITLVLLGWGTTTGQEEYPYPVYPIPAKYKLKSSPALPYKVDNTERKFFPATFNQTGMSCNQASSIGYVLNYELNQMRDLSSQDEENLCSPGFVYNFLNSGSYGIGVSYLDSWEVVKMAGCANITDYPYYTTGNSIWMSGYDKYYRAMQNRIIRNYSLPVGTPEGLQVLKQYLYNHLEDSPYGGVGSIQISSDRMDTETWIDPETGKSWPVIRTFGKYVGHALTIAGYNDSVRVDLNGDWRYTNDIDITGDGEVTQDDWEIGAVLAVNSWGSGFWNNGKVYILYSVLSRYGNNGGIWGQSVHVVKTLEKYTPQLSMRVVMRHEQRNSFRITAGVAADTAATKPQYEMEYPMFNFSGDNSPLLSDEGGQDSTRFEFGLDISPLLTFITPGQPVRFFLVVEEKDPLDQVTGRVDEVSVVHYNGEPAEYPSAQQNISLINNGFTYIPITCSIDFTPIQVEPPVELSYACGEPFSVDLQATGGIPPYRWELVNGYQEKTFTRLYEDLIGDTLANKTNNYRYHRINLPFAFPLYGEKYTTFIADVKGILHFDHEDDPYPYQVDEALSFKVRKSIAPFSADLRLLRGEDLLVKSVTDSVVSLQWRASVMELVKPYPVNVRVNLYPDGSIEFHYGAREIPPKGDYDWTIGISNGDSRLVDYAAAHENRIIFEHFGIRFTPMIYPDDLSLTDAGRLSGIARDTNKIWNISVKVTDSYSQTQYAAIPISTVNWEESNSLAQNYPNPFNRSTTITFRIPAESRVILDVFDLRGRRVRQILDSRLLAGEHTIYWNAKDEANRDVVPGIYLYRLRAGELAETGRMVIVR